MKSLSFIAALLLTACVQAPQLVYYSPQQQAQAVANNVCTRQNLTGNKLNKCISDKYAQLLPAYVQQDAISRQNYQNSQDNLNRSMNDFADSLRQPQGVYCNTTTTMTGSFSTCH